MTYVPNIAVWHACKRQRKCPVRKRVCFITTLSLCYVVVALPPLIEKNTIATTTTLSPLVPVGPLPRHVSHTCRLISHRPILNCVT
jgi:hypothetical protein